MVTQTYTYISLFGVLLGLMGCFFLVGYISEIYANKKKMTKISLHIMHISSIMNIQYEYNTQNIIKTDQLATTLKIPCAAAA